jgi:hypothetical protein
MNLQNKLNNIKKESFEIAKGETKIKFYYCEKSNGIVVNLLSYWGSFSDTYKLNKSNIEKILKIYS